ncbi:porin PorA family protein [Streptacidiphilus rugosus]|uniref:porin PorA family protein n=1 Tax=Streptacidiphilus rugosus TaxID=405783 RepID=UPI000566D3E8|nr:porin PorA family protein [Streptacidiphilus rugosus]
MLAKKWVRIVALVLGVVLIAGAFVLAFVITPNLVARLPSDTNAQRSYSGTFKVLLDSRAVARGNLAAAFTSNVPMTVDRTVTVKATSGGSALVADKRTTSAAGQAVEQTTWQYALDRKSLEPVTNHPKDWVVVDAQGLTVSFPFGAEKKNYTGWVPETTSTTPVTYVRTASKAGFSTYVYTSAYGPSRITDRQVLAGLPPAIPKATLALAVNFGTATAAQKAQLAALLPKLSDPVPLAYTLQGTDTFWVEPETGVVIDVQRHQVRTVGVPVPGTSTLVPLFPVADYSYGQTAAGTNAAVHDANKGRNALTLYGTTLPIIVGLVGAALVGGGVFLTLRARKEAEPGA